MVKHENIVSSIQYHNIQSNEIKLQQFKAIQKAYELKCSSKIKLPTCPHLKSVHVVAVPRLVKPSNDEYRPPIRETGMALAGGPSAVTHHARPVGCLQCVCMHVCVCVCVHVCM